MSRHLLVPLIALAALAACADRDLPTTPPTALPTDASGGVSNARERLAARLAVALADPVTRNELVDRLAASTAPEGKLQFQALVRADGSRLLARLAASGGTSVAELLADLDAARGLELYLPVEAHRAAWNGDTHFLVGTIGQDGEAPVAFDAAGNRSILHPDRPPTTPVIALVPQEFDFTGGRPHLKLSCWTACGGDADWGGGGGGTSATQGGLFLTKSHFEETFESWIKGKPEFEYHVYGEDPKGGSLQLSCVGEHAGGPYAWDQNTLDWTGAVPLLTEADRIAYEKLRPGGVVRIVAWEDDDEPCVVRADGGYLATLLRNLDAVYRSWTSGKMEPTLVRGIKAAPSAFDLAKSVRNFITTSDDFIGNAVETSIAGWGPGGANWLLKTEGTRTTGWFVTEYRR
jgi:hypothetical protein